MGTSANSEQLKAIEHTGGVLLKAGAGSGKTFVLKEHMIYRTVLWNKDYLNSKSLSADTSFLDFLSSQYSKIILMTFTKKAAGELQIRLRNEFSQKAEIEGGFWIEALQALDKLTVTTIHGFCLKLIKEGHFINIDSQAVIIDSEEFSKKIKFLFRSWIDTQDELNPFLIKDSEKVIESLVGVFSDPVLRKSWAEIDITSYKTSDSTIKELFEIHSLDELFTTSAELNEENQGKKWYDFLIEFQQLKIEELTLDNILKVNSFFESKKYKIPVSPRGKTVTPEEKAYYTLVKDLNKFLKSDGEDIKEYINQFDTSIVPWFNSIKSAFDFIESKYYSVPGVTFSDLEYIVHKELKNKDAQKSVVDRYNYLIVDEFQDTSFIQYEIIKKVLDNDLKKLFCVGDIKQAIYGFRGGELGVFLNCSKEIPLVLSLKNNYRSDQSVINFNNKFFENIFAKDLKFEGKERNPVEVEYQEVPIPERAQGLVESIQVDLEGVESLSNSELELIEAYGILNEIIRNKPIKDVVLYKKLKPSLVLMGLLIKENISFTAQVKVPYLEDPILAIFLTLIEKNLNKNDKKEESLLLILTAYFQIIGVRIDESDLISNVKSFYEAVPFFGLYQSYYAFLTEMKIFNSNYKNNIKYIENICRLYLDDVETLIYVISQKGSQSYSLDFNFGNEPETLNIMSAHASKGLEFNRVYLGGIYTNDKAFPDQSLFGKFPLSFIWKDDLNSKKRYKTPQLLLEKEIAKRKDFSESKRLFYVAATRAENELRWVNVNFQKVKFRKQSNSWVQAINSWKEDAVDAKEIAELDGGSTYIVKEDQIVTTSNKRPLFQIDEVGLTLSDNNLNTLIMPELSVTRFGIVHTCPRKFYLKNILKLNIENIEKVNLFDDAPIEVKSSSKRGTQIHDELSQVLENNFLVQNLDLKYLKAYEWVLELLKSRANNFSFISEKALKFEVFGFMISGIPDLILNPIDDSTQMEIWDYKTGRSKEEGDSVYHFQLMCYAYAQYTLGLYSKEKLIKIVLCYVDEERIVDKTISYSDVVSYLKGYWLKTNNPWIQNKDACEECEFSKICK